MRKIGVLFLALILITSQIPHFLSFSNQSYEKISATVDPGINIVLNDMSFLTRDGAGNPVYPTIINGSTYLPMRGVANVAGLSVDWDGGTQTITLKDKNDDALSGSKHFEEPSINPSRITYRSVSEQESNDTFETAQKLPALPVSVTGQIADIKAGSPDRNDYYEFEMSADGLLRIDLNSDIETNARFTLYGKNAPRSNITREYNHSWEHRSTEIPLQKGTYVLLIDVGTGSPSGAYTLKLAELPLPVQAGKHYTFEEAFPLTIGERLYQYTFLKDTFNNAETFNYYSFELKEMQTVLINTISDITTNVKIDLYEISRPRSSIASDASQFKTNRFIVQTLQPGKYVIRVTGDRNADKGYFGLLVDSVRGRPVSQQVEATVRPDINIVINGKPFIPKDPAGNILSPVLIAGTTYLPVRAVASAVDLNIGWDQSTRTVILAHAPIGNIMQTIDNTFRSQGAKNETGPNSDFYDAVPIPLVGSINGTLNDQVGGQRDSEDYFKIEVPHDGKLTLSVQSNAPLNNIHLSLYGYNAPRSSIFQERSGTLNNRTQSAYVKKGTYVVMVSTNVRDTGTYTLTTSFEAPRTQANLNETFDQAAYIELDTPVKSIIGRVDSTNQTQKENYYRVILFRPGTLEINLTSDRTTNARVTLYASEKPRGHLIRDYDGTQAQRKITQSVQPGVYYILVTHSGEPGYYEFTATLK